MKPEVFEIAKKILDSKNAKITEKTTAYANANIALCKYWGKRDQVLNLPTNDSISISLQAKGTKTKLSVLRKANQDQVILNGQNILPSESFYKRVVAHIDIFRCVLGQQLFCIETTNNVPTQAGLASSASGFAALTLAISQIYSLNLSMQHLSILARLGSGSASRSLFSGFVHWHKGTQLDGMDSFAEPLTWRWPSFRIGLLLISKDTKKVNSRDGMQRALKTSPFHAAWINQTEADKQNIIKAIKEQNFKLLGSTAEQNALSMHATMLSSWPPLLYWHAETLEQLEKIWALRKKGYQIYATIDAGPNIKILFEERDEAVVKRNFPHIDIIIPFQNTPHIILR